MDEPRYISAEAEEKAKEAKEKAEQARRRREQINDIRKIALTKASEEEATKSFSTPPTPTIIERIIKDAYESPFPKKLTMLILVLAFLAMAWMFSLGGVGLLNGLMAGLLFFTGVILFPYAIDRQRRHNKRHDHNDIPTAEK